jgi:hypothetical protein
MNNIDHLCAICAEEGVSAVLRVLPAGASLTELAQACRWNAEQAQAQGSQAQADRLLSAAQYLAYLDLPYDID